MNEVQQIILNIFIEVKKLCEKHGIRYYAIGGTCIGAVRHKGFIPWDNDLDVAIPIEQYNKFLEIAEKELPDHLSVYTCDNIIHNPCIFSKIVDDRTTLLERTDSLFPEAYKGVWIDIMPISGMPSDEAKRKDFYKKIKIYNKLNTLLRFPIWYVNGKRAKIIWFFIRPMRLFLPMNYYSKKWMKLLHANPFFEASYVGYVWWPYTIEKLTFRKAAFESTVELPFETTIIACPIGWDEYLTVQFGDYMVLPPESEQISHVGEVVDFHKSYKEYRKEALARKGEQS